MRIIKLGQPRCLCMDKLYDFEQANGGFEVGTVVQCDCLVTYTKQDSQFDGKYWARTKLADKLGLERLRG